MGRQIPWGDVPEPDSGFTPGLAYLMTVETAELTTSSTGKAMVKVMLRCVAPTPGRVAYENWTIGDQNDPEGRDPQQLLRNNFFKRLTKLLRKSKVKLEGKSLEQALEAVQGKNVGVLFTTETDKQSGKPRSRPDSFFSEGEIPPGTDTTGKMPTRAPVAAAPTPGSKPRATPPPPPPPADDDDDTSYEE